MILFSRLFRSGKNSSLFEIVLKFHLSFVIWIYFFNDIEFLVTFNQKPKLIQPQRSSQQSVKNTKITHFTHYTYNKLYTSKHVFYLCYHLDEEKSFSRLQNFLYLFLTKHHIQRLEELIFLRNLIITSSLFIFTNAVEHSTNSVSST